LVYDLGGGTFDVTILKLSDGCDFHVLSTSGDTQLGGSDFDDELAEIIIQKLKDKNIVCDATNDYLMSEIRYHSEKAKKTLSQLEKVNVTIPLLRQQYGNVSVSLSREEFESSIDKYLLRTKACILQAVKDAEITLTDIDEVVFVGGSTRIPYVSKKVQEWTSKKPNKSINPDEAVSVGAAIQASVLSGSSDKEVYLIDVCPLSLGVETQGGVMATLISRNTQVPAVVKEIFTTAFDNQDLVEVKVFQGERPLTKDNISLGQFTLDNIKKASRGIPKIEVSFQIDANGVLSVSAQDSETGLQKSLEINQSSLSAEEIKKILKSAEENKLSDENLRLILNLQAQVQDYEIQVTELLRTKIFNHLESEELEDIQKSLKLAESSQNLELLKGIVSSAKTIVQDMSKIVYDRAKENLTV
jgi:molecular chaperone DnaK